MDPESPETPADPDPTQSMGPAETAGTLIGRYHLLQKIGEGGMGEVWLAEQKEPIGRRVAIKLVKAGMNTRQVIARFESERQALALMDHPTIAKVFDAGSTPQGAPYFAMEYVAGLPITAFCDRYRLSTRERLELFVHVCAGIQHAHQKAIIHRDLKPSNILVTEMDGKPMPKVIDFGVAKALAQKLTAETIFTQVGAIVGTPEYMSPEQALSSGEDIDTRTDVYSLGVVLYELLAGALPIELRKISFEEFLRSLREKEPLKPSTKIRTEDPATSAEVARKRQTEPPALAKQMRGDLDSIALKALEKERGRRYGSPEELAADIGRYLRNEAVLAVPPSFGYRTRKFARRYRLPLATVTAFVLVLISAAAVSIRQSIRANREAAVAQAVNDFLQNDLLAQASAANQSSPSTNPDPHLEVRTALDRAAARISGKFDRQPEVEAAIRGTIGTTYFGLGLYPEARKQLERVLELQRRTLRANDPSILKTIFRLGSVATEQGKYPEAEALLNEALKNQRRALGPESADTLQSMNSLALVYLRQGKYPQAEALDNQLLEIGRRVLGPEHPDTLKSMNSLAAVYLRQGKYPQAEALCSRALEISRRVLGSEHPDTMNPMQNLATAYFYQGKYPQAEALFNELLEIRRRVLGPEHPNTLALMINLGGALNKQGKFHQAEAVLGSALNSARRVLGPEHPTTLTSMNNLAVAYLGGGEYAQAAAIYSQVVEIGRRVLGPDHPNTLRGMANLALTYAEEGEYAQAEDLFVKTLERARRVLGPEHPDMLQYLTFFGFMYQRQGRYGLAETYAAEALAGFRRALGPQHPATLDSAANLARAYISEGKFADAEPLAREAFEFNRGKQPEDWQRFEAESLLGAGLAGQKKFADAEPLLVEGYQGMLARKERTEAANWDQIDRTHGWLVQLYRSWGKPEKVAEWSKK